MSEPPRVMPALPDELSEILPRVISALLDAEDAPNWLALKPVAVEVAVRLVRLPLILMACPAPADNVMVPAALAAVTPVLLVSALIAAATLAP